MPVDVFVAYVDTYIGKQLLRQFEASPHLFTVHGCTWSAEAAQELSDRAALRHQQSLLQLNGTVISSISALSTARGHDDSQSMMVAADTNDQSRADCSRATQAPRRDREGEKADGAQLLSDTTSLAASQGTRQFLHEAGSEHTETAVLGVSSPADGQHGETAAPATGSVRFFSRQDAASVRRALSSCEWVIVEQRQSQEVLEILSCVQQGLFDRPKKFVLLSSFMSWYATPPLSPPTKDEGDGEAEEAAAVAAAVASFRGVGGDAENEEDEDDIGDDITAPYPPPPEAPASDEDESAAAGDRDSKEKDDADDDDEAVEGQHEVLTEDQYNRRVPHVKYYNWRDAEKAVAAAHHAKGLPLDTYVVFAGLPYGEGEDLLEPFFRQAWCGSSTDSDHSTTSTTLDKRGERNESLGGTLPIYGDGHQRVPLIHVRDLATFTRKLLHHPTSALPSRYIFATDGARPTWRTIMETINHSFGGRCKLVPVSPAEFPLHKHIEQFTVDLRVERGTMATLIEDMRVNAAEGDNVDAAGRGGGEGSLWVAEGGLRKHAEKVAQEFCEERRVTPLRLVLQGPPLAGKRFVGRRIAAHYRLPCFSIDDVVAAYKACLAGVRKEKEDYRARLLAAELQRRKDIKERRILNAYRKGKKLPVAAAVAASPHGGVEDGAAASAAAETERAVGSSRKGSNARRSMGTGGRRSISADTATATATATAVALGAGDTEAANEPDAALYELTEAEKAEAEELVAERFDSSAKVARWRDKIGEMERVLLMRVRVAASSQGSSPQYLQPLQGNEEALGGSGPGPVKKRAAAAAAKPKKLTKEQQRKKEEEELLLAKEALRDAPFQDRALAIMLRWRLNHADCRTQGYLLHGFPRTVEQARLVFGAEPLPLPATEEEALNPPPPPPPASQQRADDGEEGVEGEDGVDPLAGLSSEPSDEHRLPDYVLVLEAPESFLLDRLAAVSARNEQQQQQEEQELSDQAVAAAPLPSTGDEKGEGEQEAAMTPGAAKAAVLQRFQEHLRTFEQQFVLAAYSMLSYWECAVTEPGRVTPGGRRPEVHLITVHDNEPLVPPPPPASAFECAPPCQTELTARDIVGAPHNFGKTPLELHQEAVRAARLAQEQREAEQRRVQEERQRNAASYDAEAQLREAVEDTLLSSKKADLAALEAREAPLRSYLMESVIPLVSKGLIEVAAVRPENPLEYLSEWLLRHNPNNDVFMDL